MALTWSGKFDKFGKVGLKSSHPIWTNTSFGFNPVQHSSYSRNLTAANTTKFSQIGGTDLSTLGLTLTSGVGQCTIAGTPPIYGTYSISLRAEDDSGDYIDKTLSLTIDPATPVWTTNLLTNPLQASSYNSGNINATYGATFSQFSGTTLSTLGLTLTSSAGHCVISGTPNTTGTFSVTLRATNGSATADKTYSLVIDPANPVWTTNTLPDLIQGSSYNSGNINATFAQSFSQSSGTTLSSLGLTLTSSAGHCVISGTPNTSGTPSITLTATNGAANTNKTFTLNIYAVPVWTTTTVPSLTQFSSYDSDHINATNATSFTQSGGTTLSTIGLTLNSNSGYCVIVGTPTSSGTYSITLSAINGPANASQTFSLNVGSAIDNYWNNNSLFLPFNNNVTDISGNNLSITNSNVGFSNSVVKYQPYSAFFSGADNSYLVGTQSNATRFSGDFTIELWIRPTSYSTHYSNGNIVCFANFNGGSWSTNGFGLVVNQGNGYLSVGCPGGQFTISPSIAPTLNVWSYVAITRSGSTITLYLNGSSIGTASSSANFSDGYCNIGFNGWGGGYNYIGYMSELRITNGYCRYTGNFTPPTTTLPTVAPTTYDPFWNSTTCLLHFDNNITDTSGHISLTNNGGVTFSNSIYKFGGYSSYFNGSAGSGFLSGPNTDAMRFPGDFTIETWLRTSISDGCMIDTRVSTNGQDWTGFSFEFISGQLRVDAGGPILPLCGSISINTWYHVALVRSGSTLSAYINGSLVGSSTYANNLSDGTCCIGKIINGSIPFNGYMDDFRITKFARYTANFTPPNAQFLNHA